MTPRFKGNVTGRYAFDVGTFESYVQGAVVHVGNRPAALTIEDVTAFGDLESYTKVDLSAGFRRNNWALDFFISNAFDEAGELTRFAQCATDTCGTQSYTVHTPPRSIGVRFSQEF